MPALQGLGPKAQRIPRRVAPAVGSPRHRLDPSKITIPHCLQPRPLPTAVNVARLSPVLPAQAQRPSASRARTQGPRRVRTAGLSPRSDGAVSRELGVNSPEWRPEACSPRRHRYSGPSGPELEAAAGTLSGRFPEAPLLLQICAAAGPLSGASRVRGPEGGSLRGRWLGPPCDPGPAGSGAGRGQVRVR